MTWPPPGPVPVPGAHVAGRAAAVIDAILRRHGPAYLSQLAPAVQREVEAAARAIHGAAQVWRASTSADGNAALPPGPVRASSDRDELGAAEAAHRLGVSPRRIRQLADAWAADGLARKCGGDWRIDATAVQLEVDRRSDAAA
jgi:hypothetical protein